VQRPQSTELGSTASQKKALVHLDLPRSASSSRMLARQEPHPTMRLSANALTPKQNLAERSMLLYTLLLLPRLRAQ
jgi:hypothetical protein